ncbi:MAG TPA: GNAT family N-acetyltransferase [Candidatus Limnocylindria bacterium]|nr:GNAT family N-acetyltransferase [Candidatus Limnocylindria bacterium]
MSDSLKRQRAGAYATADGRFTAEASSSGWLLFDAEQTDELGLPLARGPFPTLDGAKAAIGPARSTPAPASDLARRAPRGAPGDRAGAGAKKKAPARSTAAGSTPKRTPPELKRPRRPAVVVREIRTVDGDALRALWAECGFKSLGDDDRSLARLARRNPGLVLVAAEGTRVVGSALGAWDGRRGWIYHVATARTHRRQGIAARLIAEIESGLRALGCPKVNVMVRHENDDGAAFWRSQGYGAGPARQLAKELDTG